MTLSPILTELLNPNVLIQVAEHLAGVGAESTYRQAADMLDFGTPFAQLICETQRQIQAGYDPLGSAYCLVHSPAARRAQGQTFSPVGLVSGMFDWAARHSGDVARIVDPGAGSGRYALFGLRRFPQAKVIAIERDPALALILRANATALGVSDRLETIVADYREISLPTIEGATLFIGNPPYVRHHGITPAWKQWYSDKLRVLGHACSQLAGLHLHFFLKTLELSRRGDLGCFVSAAEWLDVNYGQSLRDLMTNGLGGKAVFVVSPEIPVFDDAMVSATVTCFAPHSAAANIEFQRIECVQELTSLRGGVSIPRSQARAESKWSILIRGGRNERPAGHIELGDLFKVQRGQVTGLNKIWVHGAHSPRLPGRFLFPSITGANDIIGARFHVIDTTHGLKSVVDLPMSLDDLESHEREQVDVFLKWAKTYGAHKTYIALHRAPWWRVRLKDPAPIVVTYMGRRPPVFARNPAGARLINVAHGLYPRDNLTIDNGYFRGLVAWLNTNVARESGRVYAGGLTKFEPSEVMRLYIPDRRSIAETSHAAT